MNTTTRVAAFVSGAAAIALGALTIIGPSFPDEHWGTRGSIVNALGIVVFLAMAVASERLVMLLRLGRIGIVGIRVAQTGLALMTIESVASQVHGGNTWGPVFMLGILLSLVGFLVQGIDGLRRPGARWLAMLPLVAMLVGIATGDQGGFLLLGVAWCGLGLGSVVRSGAAENAADDAQPAGRAA
jgi:hypothetical protein